MTSGAAGRVPHMRRPGPLFCLLGPTAHKAANGRPTAQGRDPRGQRRVVPALVLQADGRRF